MDIGKMMKDRRLDLDLTLEEVGNAVGVSKSTVKKWEDGFISNMKRDKIALLANVLKLNPITFITGETTIDSVESMRFTNKETKVMNAYRAQPDMQPAVNKILGVEDDEEPVYCAVARSNNVEYEKPKHTKEQLKNLKRLVNDSD